MLGVLGASVWPGLAPRVGSQVLRARVTAETRRKLCHPHDLVSGHLRHFLREHRGPQLPTCPSLDRLQADPSWASSQTSRLVRPASRCPPRHPVRAICSAWSPPAASQGLPHPPSGPGPLQPRLTERPALLGSRAPRRWLEAMTSRPEAGEGVTSQCPHPSNKTPQMVTGVRVGRGRFIYFSVFDFF